MEILSDIFLTNTTVKLCPVKDRNDGANVLHKNKLLTCLALQWKLETEFDTK